jgi:hypothetical protein
MTGRCSFVMGINDFVHACLTGFINNFDPKKIILSIIAQSGDASSQIRMDSGIIGSKEFVSTRYQRFKNLFATKNKKVPPSPSKAFLGCIA